MVLPVKLILNILKLCIHEVMRIVFLKAGALLRFARVDGVGPTTVVVQGVAQMAVNRVAYRAGCLPCDVGFPCRELDR